MLDALRLEDAEALVSLDDERARLRHLAVAAERGRTYTSGNGRRPTRGPSLSGCCRGQPRARLHEKKEMCPVGITKRLPLAMGAGALLVAMTAASALAGEVTGRK